MVKCMQHFNDNVTIFFDSVSFYLLFNIRVKNLPTQKGESIYTKCLLTQQYSHLQVYVKTCPLKKQLLRTLNVPSESTIIELSWERQIMSWLTNNLYYVVFSSVFLSEIHSKQCWMVSFIVISVILYLTTNTV